LELSIRPAILVDAALGAAFVMRYVDPLAALGRLGAELEADAARVVRRWDARRGHGRLGARHRPRRFEETTDANLKRPADLIEPWWALERRRLGSREADQT
jgi:hypothetical protein